MARPYWLLSLLPVIGGPLAFWFENRALLRRVATAAGLGARAGGVGGGIVGVAEGFGHAPGDATGPGAANPLGEAIDAVARDPSTDPRLGKLLRQIEGDPTSPE